MSVDDALTVVTPSVRTASGSRGIGLGNAVLHLHRGEVDVGAALEGDRQRIWPSELAVDFM